MLTKASRIPTQILFTRLKEVYCHRRTPLEVGVVSKDMRLPSTLPELQLELGLHNVGETKPGKFGPAPPKKGKPVVVRKN